MLLKINKHMTIPELSKKTGRSEPTIHRHLSKLIEEGKLVRLGSRKNGSWEVM
jgi:predicted HTH transcriptional regulator